MPNLTRRQFFRSTAGAAVVPLVVPAIDLPSHVLDTEPITAGTIVTPQMLWPGVKAWWGRNYDENQKNLPHIFATTEKLPD